MIAVIGENMNIRRFEKITTDGLLVSYIHAGGKIGVLVEVYAVPTTFFVDSSGRIVGKVYTGSRTLKQWQEIVESFF